MLYLADGRVIGMCLEAFNDAFLSHNADSNSIKDVYLFVVFLKGCDVV